MGNGDYLKLTTERLLFPSSQTDWQGKGLVPDIRLLPGEDFSLFTARLPL